MSFRLEHFILFALLVGLSFERTLFPPPIKVINWEKFPLTSEVCYPITGQPSAHERNRHRCLIPQPARELSHLPLALAVLKQGPLLMRCRAGRRRGLRDSHRTLHWLPDPNRAWPRAIDLPRL